VVGVVQRAVHAGGGGFLECVGAPTRAGVRAGLLSHTERKNSWNLAELAGDASPDGLQWLLNFSPWDEDACRDAVARNVMRHLGDPGAVLAVDETGFLKGQDVRRRGQAT
jgi:SRSO17 transposase